MRYLRKPLISASIAFFALQCSGLAAPLTDLQQGIACYNSGDYAGASSFLHSHLAKNLKDATAHYYLANTLLKLGQAAHAAGEYRKAFELAPANSQLQKFCLLALKNVSLAAGQNSDGTDSFSSKSGEADPSAITKSSGGAGGAGSASTEVSKTLDRIKQQSLMAKQNKENYANATAKDFIGRGNFDEGKLLSERNARINQLLQPDMIDIHGRPIYLDHTAEIEQLKRDYAERIKEAHAVAEEDAAKHKQIAAKDTEKMLSDVDNLRSQLTNSRGVQGSAKLQSTGTNFYTRQYGDPRSVAVRREEVVPDELLATPDKMILDPRARPGQSQYRVIKDPMVADQMKLKSTPGTSLRVKGSLIKK